MNLLWVAALLAVLLCLGVIAGVVVAVWLVASEVKERLRR